MTPKSLFIIIIRVIGIYFLIDIIQVVPKTLTTLAMLMKGDSISGIIGIVVSLLLIGVYLILVKYILFNPDKIVEKLRLDKNFSEEKFELNIHPSTIIKISIIIIGGMMLLEYFVPLVLNVFTYIQAQNKSEMTSMLDTFSGNAQINTMDLVHGVIMTLIGYFLVTNSRVITNLIERKRRK